MDNPLMTMLGPMLGQQAFQQGTLGNSATIGNPQGQEDYRMQLAKALAQMKGAERQQSIADSMLAPKYIDNSGLLGVIAQIAQKYAGKKMGDKADARYADATARYYKGEASAEDAKAKREADRQAANTARLLEIIRRGDKAEMLANGIELPKGEQYKPDWKERRKADGSTEWFDINGGPPQSQASAGLDKPGYGAAQFDPEAFYADVGNLIGSHGGRITSTSGGKHNTGSKHYDGRAVDVGMGRESPEQQQAIIDALGGDPRFIVSDERTRPEGQEVWGGPHLHVEPRFAQAGGQQSGSRIVPGNAPQSKERSEYRTLSQQEVAGLGLPQGTVAQMSPSGQVQIVNKPRDMAGGGGGKPLTAATIQKLTKEAGRSDLLQSLSNEFKNDYAGNTWTGDLENYAGRLGLPGGDKAQSEWWQQYDRHKNAVRNELFGAALTATEAKAFEQADINTRMEPSVIRTNLAKQQEIIKNALERQAKVWVAQGYNRDAIQEATGITLPDAPRDAYYKGPQGGNDDDLINKYLRP